MDTHRSRQAGPAPVHGPHWVAYWGREGAEKGAEEQVPSAAGGFLNPETPMLLAS